MFKCKSFFARIIFLLFSILIFLLNGCSSSLGKASSGSSSLASKQIQIGKLPNDSIVWLSVNNLAVQSGKTTVTNISLTGGTDNQKFSLNFSTKKLQSSSLNDSKLNSTVDGLYVDSAGCNLGTAGSGLPSSCQVSVTSDASLDANVYEISPSAQSADGTITKLSPITVLVSKVLNTKSNNVSYFIIDNVPATISNDTVSVVLPYGTDLTALAPTYVTNGADVSVNGNPQVNGETTNNFSNSTNSPVIYTVTAQDGETQNYQVIVTTAPAVANSMNEFSIDGNVGIQTNSNTYTVTLPYGVPLTDLVARFNTTGVQTNVNNVEQVNGISMNDFTNSVNVPLVYSVTAADGSVQNYNVIVKNAPSDVKSITHFTLNGNDFTANIDESNGVINAVLPYGTNLQSITVGYSIDGASLMLESGNVVLQSGYSQDFTNPVTYTVYAADGSLRNYAINLSIALNSASELSSLMINGMTGVLNGNTFNVTVPYKTSLSNLVVTFTTSGNAVKVGDMLQVSGSTINDFSTSATTPVVYTVFAADGSSQNYNVIVKNEPKNSFAYIANYDDTYSICMVNSLDGTLENCLVRPSLVDAKGSPSSYIWGVVVNNGFTYFTNGTANNYTKCTINNTDGTLYDCVTNTLQNGVVGNLAGITFYNNYAYILDMYYNSFTVCSVNSVDGSLFNCNFAPTDSSSSGGHMSIAIYNGHAYIANADAAVSGAYTQCTVNSTDGSLFNCNNVQPSGAGTMDNSYGVTASNGYVYFSDWYTGSYTQCTVNDTDGTLNNCNTIKPTTMLNDPMGVAIKDGSIYFLWGNYYYMKCSVNPLDGTLSSCNNYLLTGYIYRSMAMAFY